MSSKEVNRILIKGKQWIIDMPKKIIYQEENPRIKRRMNDDMEEHFRNIVSAYVY